MPEFETATSDVPEQKYKELSNIVGNYWQKEQGYDNKSNQSTVIWLIIPMFVN